MAAEIVNIAASLVTALSGATLSQPITAQRSYTPTRELTDDGILVTVVPAGEESQRDTRRSTRHQYQLHIGVQKRVADTTPATLDPLVLLVQEIADELAFGSRHGNAVLPVASVSTLYDEERLRELHEFTAILRFEFQGWREAPA